jgi:hypothetical protein
MDMAMKLTLTIFYSTAEQFQHLHQYLKQMQVVHGQQLSKHQQLRMVTML